MPQQPFSLAAGAAVVVACCLSPVTLHAADTPKANPVPSIQLTAFTGFTGHNFCSSGGSANLTELDSGFNASQSDCTYVTVSGPNTVGSFCESGPFGAGTFSDYGIDSDLQSYSVPAGTPITAIVESFNGFNGSGPVSFLSRMAFACDTGQVLGIANFVPSTAGCDETAPDTLCLNNGRFEVSATFHQNGIGKAQAVQLTSDTGYFWFFNPGNVEALVKVIDGCGTDGKFWVFAGGLTNVQTEISVRDTLTGVSKQYDNPANTPFQPVQDTGAFGNCLPSDQLAPEQRQVAAEPPAEAVPDALPVPNPLLLHNGRFKVTVTWASSPGTHGNGTPYDLTADTGYFWFFNSSNVEMVLKILDGCGVNGAYWVFAGGLTNVGVTITITDTKTGKTQVYNNHLGKAFQPIQDTEAFPSCP